MWIPPEEKDPILLHAPTRKSIALFGAVQANTGQMVSMMAPSLSKNISGVFESGLKKRKRGKKLILILDNARYHHATMIQP